MSNSYISYRDILDRNIMMPYDGKKYDAADRHRGTDAAAWNRHSGMEQTSGMEQAQRHAADKRHEADTMR